MQSCCCNHLLHLLTPGFLLPPVTECQDSIGWTLHIPSPPLDLLLSFNNYVIHIKSVFRYRPQKAFDLCELFQLLKMLVKILQIKSNSYYLESIKSMPRRYTALRQFPIAGSEKTQHKHLSKQQSRRWVSTTDCPADICLRPPPTAGFASELQIQYDPQLEELSSEAFQVQHTVSFPFQTNNY